VVSPWHILWLSPLADMPGYQPETGAMRAILPYIDDLADGSSALASFPRSLVGAAPLARTGITA
jgi:uncharacterized protein with von Willebrand factor type A (vWA) domain